MLQGILRYRDDDLGEVSYAVTARHTMADLKIYIENINIGDGYFNAIRILDKVDMVPKNKLETLDPEDLAHYEKYGYYYDHQRGIVHTLKDGSETRLQPLDTRRLDVQVTNKFKTNLGNFNMASRVSALIRYMLVTGKQEKGSMYEEVENLFSSTKAIEAKGVGTMTLCMGFITQLHCENKYVSLELTEVSENKLSKTIFNTLKQKDNFGNILSPTPVKNIAFKLDSALLGFEYIPAIQKEYPNLFGMYTSIEDVINANPQKNTGWILARNYVIVTDENVDAIIAEFLAHDGPIAFDTETSGLNITFKSCTGEHDQLVGVVLSKEVGTGYYFPLQHKLFPNLCGGDHTYFMERYMKKLLESKPIITHNLQYDWKVAYIYGINTNVVFDTMLAFGVTKKYQESSFQIGLKALAKNLFGLDMFELSDFIVDGSFSNSDIKFWDLPLELVRRYAPVDADITLMVYEYILKHRILEEFDAYKIFQIEIDFAMAAAYSEFYGYHIEVDKIPELQKGIEDGMKESSEYMFKLAGREFNPASAQQLATIMYDEMGVPQNGASRSTDKETIKRLSLYKNSDGSPKYPFVKAIKDYRESHGIFKNFLKKLPEFCTSDGYIFPSTMPLGTTTGRVSVKNPNYQSYNDVVKKFVTPRKDFMTGDSDFAQIEQRVLVSMAKHKILIHDFDDPDLDYHTYQAARMFNIPYANVPKTLRQQSKGVNFGLPYGMGDNSLGGVIFGEKTKENALKAAKLREKFFLGQEVILEFFEHHRDFGVREGYTVTDFGRRRYYHKGQFDEAAIRRQAGNHVIQGTAADIYKIAVIRLFKAIVQHDWLGLVLFNAFVHDELLFEIHKSINPYYFTKVWRDTFEVKIDNYCRLYAGLGYGKCWYDAKKQDLAPLYIDELEAQYTEGMDWDEDQEAFIAKVDSGYKAHKTRRVHEFITHPENQGEVIKPMISTLLVEMVDLHLKKADDATKDSYCKLTGTNIREKFSALQAYLMIFCQFNNIEYTHINIKAPEEAEVTQEQEAQGIDYNSFQLDGTEEMSGDELGWLGSEQIGYKRVLDPDTSTYTVYFRPYILANTNMLEYCTQKGYFTETGLYDVKIFLNNNKHEMLYTHAKVSKDNYYNIQNAFKIFWDVALQQIRTS